MSEESNKIKPVDMGDYVNYVLDSSDSAAHAGEVRPAIVVKVWGNYVCNLQVLTDSDAEGKYNDALPPVMWKTSIDHNADNEQGTWHYREERKPVQV